jgi:hypothetical protein
MFFCTETITSCEKAPDQADRATGMGVYVDLQSARALSAAITATPAASMFMISSIVGLSAA